jgi:phage terminase large subunit-like protein
VIHVPDISPEQIEELILQEELDRILAREQFLPFYQRMTGFKPPRHFKVIAKLLEAMEHDRIDRAMLFAPPRHIKTLGATILFPAWLMGRHPAAKIMSVVHTQNYAAKIGRNVRNLLRNPAWPFDDVQLADDSQAKEQWATTSGGEYNGFGAIGGNQHGNPAEWLFMDDLVKGRKIAMSPHMREEVWETYKADLLSRLQGRRKQLMVFCLAGDTGVLMANGSEKPLRDVRVGDQIATYDKGRIRTSKVQNAANQGPDQVFEINMLSGRVVKANARHPFLVKTDGGEEWRRTDMLRKGDSIRSVIGVSGAASSALPTAAESPPVAGDTAHLTTRRRGAPRDTKLHLGHGKEIESVKSDTDMASRLRTTTACLPSKAAFARSAREPRTKAQSRIAATGFASTIAMTPARSGGCCATNATSPLATHGTRKPSSPPLPTYAIEDDRIVEIVAAGVEDVFDIQVAETENFIANGLVSHNTRWHMDDPAGRILPEDFDGRTGWYRDRETGEKWYVLSLPAIAEHENDPVGRKPGEWLWPESFGEKQLGGVRRRGGWMWSALFQQRPSPEEGLLFTQDHLNRYDPGKLDLTRLQVYGASDYATKEKETQKDDPDWTVHLVWGVDSEWNIYMLDAWRGRTEPDQWIGQWVRLVKKWKPLAWGEEQGQIIRSVGPFLRTMARQHQAFTQRIQLTSSLDKVQRAQPLLGMASMGHLFLPDRDKCGKAMLEFLDVFEKELLQFPTGRKDDTVDAATLFARMLDQIIAGQAPRKERSPHGDTLDDLWKRADEQHNNRRRWP